MKKVRIFLASIIAIAFFIAGFLVSWNFMEKPMSDRQFAICEQIARDVYAQQAQVEGKVEVKVSSEDFSVKIIMKQKEITVKSAHPAFRGKVDVSLHNGGELLRSYETIEALVSSTLLGVLFLLIYFLIFMGVDMLMEKVKK